MNLQKFGIISILFIVLLLSCKREEKTFEPVAQFECIQSEYYFSANVNGEMKCFNDGINNYYSSCSCGGSLSGDSSNRCSLGMSTYPVKEGDVFIDFRTPQVNTEDPEAIAALFPKRVLTFEERKDFILFYKNIISILDDVSYTNELYEGRFDDNSASIEVLSITKYDPNPGFIPYTTFHVKLSFNCKLYDSLGNYVGDIESGEINGNFFANDPIVK